MATFVSATWSRVGAAASTACRAPPLAAKTAFQLQQQRTRTWTKVGFEYKPGRFRQWSDPGALARKLPRLPHRRKRQVFSVLPSDMRAEAWDNARVMAHKAAGMRKEMETLKKLREAEDVLARKLLESHGVAHVSAASKGASDEERAVEIASGRLLETGDGQYYRQVGGEGEAREREEAKAQAGKGDGKTDADADAEGSVDATAVRVRSVLESSKVFPEQAVSALQIQHESRVAGEDPSKAQKAHDLVLSVEINVDVRRSSVRGVVQLPYSTGGVEDDEDSAKEKPKLLVFCAEADAPAMIAAGADFAGWDSLLRRVRVGWAGFQRTLAPVELLPQLVQEKQVMRSLGPRGLVPSVRSGNVVEGGPQRLAEAVRAVKGGGRIEFRAAALGLSAQVRRLRKNSETVKKLLPNLVEHSITPETTKIDGPLVANVHMPNLEALEVAHPPALLDGLVGGNFGNKVQEDDWHNQRNDPVLVNAVVGTTASSPYHVSENIRAFVAHLRENRAVDQTRLRQQRSLLKLMGKGGKNSATAGKLMDLFKKSELGYILSVRLRTCPSFSRAANKLEESPTNSPWVHLDPGSF